MIAREPSRPIANLRRAADAAVELAALIEQEVWEARRRGYSWEAIAEALAPKRGYALGTLFPGGRSVTTVRRTYA